MQHLEEHTKATKGRALPIWKRIARRYWRGDTIQGVEEMGCRKAWVLMQIVIIFVITFVITWESTSIHAEAKTIEVTYEEAQLLMKIAYCEAGNQGRDGQRYVMSVVLNRVKSPNYPDSIREVIYQPKQFATKGMDDAEITTDTHMALADIECGYVCNGIVGFEKKENRILEQYFIEKFTYKDQTFYAER